MKQKTLLLFGLLSLSFASYAALDIHNATVPEAPPTAKVLTAYMQLQNNADKPQTVVSISSPQFQRIEIHRTEIANGIARMKPVEHIRIAAGGSAELKEGGMHLMMYRPDARYKAGDCVELILHFADQSTQSLRASVEKRTGVADHIDHSQHH